MATRFLHSAQFPAERSTLPLIFVTTPTYLDDLLRAIRGWASSPSPVFMEPRARPLAGSAPPSPPRQPATSLSRWLLAAAVVAAVAAALLVAAPPPLPLARTASGIGRRAGGGLVADWLWWWRQRREAAAAGTSLSFAGGAAPLPPPAELVLTSRRVLVDGAVGPAALRLAGGVFEGVAVGDAVPAAWADIPLVDVRLLLFFEGYLEGVDGADSFVRASLVLWSGLLAGGWRPGWVRRGAIGCRPLTL